MKRFKLIDTITGWLVFGIAAVVYLLTIEPSASFWDCGEFISSANKLEVGHPPGAPFFILVGRIFAIFAEPASVAKMINSFSALCSAFTILFLFWTITHFARKIIFKGGENLSTANIIAIIGAGAVGALAYTFSDTFWFSAVEGEVYAFSSFFTAIVFWCILKWEDADDKGDASRWLILIAYLMGLSIGVHLLNLLAIPAIVLVYYFKKNRDINAKGVITALTASVAILGAVQFGLIPGFTKVAGEFELFFVNTLGMKFNSGLFVYLIITLFLIIWAIYESYTQKSELRVKLSFILLMLILGVPFLGSSIWLGLLILIAAAVFFFAFYKKSWGLRWINTAVMCVVVMVIGYSSYAMIMVRSSANPPMDQNSPEDVFSLQYYLNREQYGDNPLIYGPVFDAPPVFEIDGIYCRTVPIYGSRIILRKNKETADENDRYETIDRTFKGYKKDPRFNMLFPRMYSDSKQFRHPDLYRQWADIKGKPVVVDMCGRTETRIMPTQGENLKFFFKYQLNFMYMRYFMWNFAGRQNDIPSRGELDAGNWISGIPFIDNALYGDQSQMPDWLKNNKGHNRYFLLPLLLGIFGILWQWASAKKGKQQFWVTFALFFMTGIAIVLYLNQYPNQPRERDYAYAGSFYAFCIWIGLGVLAVVRFLNKILKLNHTISAVITSIACLGVPALMAQQNWDDHDRSGRTLCRDIGYDYLNTCKKDAVLFCNGDNDTFPLWYNQEVEEERTDIRSCNLSYISAPWYIDQMKRDYYDGKALPIDWQPSEYQAHMLDGAGIQNNPIFGGKMDINLAFEYLRSKEFIKDGYGYIFAQTLAIPVDKQKVIENKVVAPEDYDKIVDTIYIKLRGNQILKNDLMVLEILRNNDWTRPVYFCRTIGTGEYPDITKYLQIEGMAFRFVPIERKLTPDADIIFDNIMNKYRYGGISNPNVYLDETCIRMCRTLREVFKEAAMSLIDANKPDSARLVLEKFMKEVPPDTTLPYDYTMLDFAGLYYELGDMQKGDEVMKKVADYCEQNLRYVASLPTGKRGFTSFEVSPDVAFRSLQRAMMYAQQYKSPTLTEIEQIYQKYAPSFAYLFQK